MFALFGQDISQTQRASTVLTDFGIAEIHDGEPVELAAQADGGEVEHHAVEFTVRGCIISLSSSQPS
jgi:hypothetical protein